MRALLCKIHCPSSICFCKPSSNLCTAEPFKLDNSHTPSTTVVSVDDDVDVDVDVVAKEDLITHAAENGVEAKEVKEETVVGCKEEEKEQGVRVCLKSSIRKQDSDSKEGKQLMMKKVQWVDLMGKELAEIREFEPSEEEELSYDSGKSCMCVIL